MWDALMAMNNWAIEVKIGSVWEPLLSGEYPYPPLVYLSMDAAQAMADLHTSFTRVVPSDQPACSPRAGVQPTSSTEMKDKEVATHRWKVMVQMTTEAGLRHEYKELRSATYPHPVLVYATQEMAQLVAGEHERPLHGAHVQGTLLEANAVAYPPVDPDVDTVVMSPPDKALSPPKKHETITLTPAEISLMWRALTFHKNAMTRNGRIWNKHTANAHLRTRLEGLR